jgi:hypothetical protein
MALIRFLLVVLLFYLLVRLFTRYLFPYFLKRFIKKTQQKYEQQHSDYQQTSNRKKGGPKIKIPRNYHKRKKDNLGEYVDFEEVDDDK